MLYCSFCGKDEKDVRKLIQGGGEQAARELPVVRICDQCIALCAEIVSDTSKPVYGKLRDWAQLEHKGERFRWSAVRTTITTQDLQGRTKDRKEMMMILVGRIGEEASGVLHPDGTEPTEQLAIEAIERVLQ